jgi:hypothetical protein
MIVLQRIEMEVCKKLGPILIRLDSKSKETAGVFPVQMVACCTYLQTAIQEWSYWLRVLVFFSIYYFDLPQFVSH